MMILPDLTFLTLLAITSLPSAGKIAMTYPELYKELTKGRSLSYKTFFIWVLISIYQVNDQDCSLIPHPE